LAAVTQARRRGARACALVLASCAVATACVAAQDGSAARAQGVGGTVLPAIALSIGVPSGFQAVGGGDYVLHVPVQVTASVGDVRLSVADGEDLAGVAHGRLHDAAGLATSPLSVSVTGGPAQSLAAPVDPLLKVWHQPVALAPATIVIRQQLTRALQAVIPVHKLVLITVSSATP
jgi:hypothetical protein